MAVKANASVTIADVSDGIDGTGIKSTTIEYQAGSSGTSAPTGTWYKSPPSTTAANPYMWTRVTYVYTDGSNKIVYSVGSTPEGIEIGGRNLFTDSKLTDNEPIRANWSLGSINNVTSMRWTSDGLLFETSDDGVGNSNGPSFHLTRDVSGLRTGDTVTFSADIKGTIGTGWPSMRYWGSTTTSSNTWARNVAGDSLNGISSDAYTRLSVTVTLDELHDSSPDDYFCVAGGFNASIYVKNIKLEYGNKATDWTPAPEDIENKVNDLDEELHQTIVDQKTSIVSDTEQIILSALESYVDTDTYNELKTTVNAQLSIMADEINMKFSNVTENVGNVNSDVQTKFSELYKYISFSGENGIVIGNGQNQITLKIDTDGIHFSKNGEDFGFWDGNDFYTGNIMVRTTERAQFGNYAFVPRSDGSLMFLKVGG